MVLSGLTENGYHDLAHEIASKYLKTVVSVYNETGTLWENYSPDYVEKGNIAHDKFVGWTGLAPISIFFEYVLGIQANAEQNKIVWRINNLERHGVTNYPFGHDNLIDLICEERSSLDIEPKITIKSTKPIEVLIIWSGKEKLIKT
jgi:hypothetical protein